MNKNKSSIYKKNNFYLVKLDKKLFFAKQSKHTNIVVKTTKKDNEEHWTKTSLQFGPGVSVCLKTKPNDEFLFIIRSLWKQKN